MSRDWLISVCVKCETLDFVLKCDLFHAGDASFSTKLLCEMKIIHAELLKYESIVQIRVKIFPRSFKGRYIFEDYIYILKEIRSSL